MSNRQPGLVEPGREWRSPTHRRGPGPRSQRRKEKRKARRRRRFSRGFLFVLAGALLVALASVLAPMIARRADEDATLPGEEAGRVQDTWLLVGTVEADPSGEAEWLSVLSWNHEDKKGFMMYVPRSTFVEIPGYGGGPESVGKALALGREPLQMSTMSNLLGIHFDHYLRISDQAIQALFDKIEGLSLSVDQRLTRTEGDGRVRLVFAEGEQHLDGKRVAEYLLFVDESGDEISRAVRHASLWSAFFERFRGEGGPEALSQLFAESPDLVSTDAELSDLAAFMGSFASVPAGDVFFETLPVQSEGLEVGVQFYRPEADAVQRIVDRYLAPSRAEGFGQPGRRIQILNGNGIPGIGQEVAEALVPKGFRVVLDANAKSFDYDVTQIVVYSDSEEAIALAEEIRQTLGVGEVIKSRQRQSVVDITIVVGKDYARKR